MGVGSQNIFFVKPLFQKGDSYFSESAWNGFSVVNALIGHHCGPDLIPGFASETVCDQLLVEMNAFPDSLVAPETPQSFPVTVCF